MTRPAPPRPLCTLPHHFPGRHVVWSQWDAEQQKTVIMRGRVEGHRGDIRYAVVKRDNGEYVRMSCGPLAPWPTR